MEGFFVFYLFFTSMISYAQPQLKFTDTKKNFGFVKKGEAIKIEFDYTNTGNQPLIISAANVQCSCTTVDFSKEPLMPLKTAKITINFDTKSVYDRQDRTVENRFER